MNIEGKTILITVAAMLDLAAVGIVNDVFKIK